MTIRSFSISLLILSLLVALAVLGLHQLPLLKGYSFLSWLSLGFFILFSALIYFFGRKSAASKNKNLFSQVFLVATIVKMFSSIALVFGYFLACNPTSQYFILPFFFIYLCFTIFEVYFMTKLGRT